jgi:RES domain-containing protein
MILYRIARKDRIRKLNGTGARITGGRWNPKGMAVLYTSSSASLAILEKLVHVDRDLLPSDLVIAEIEIEDACSLVELSSEDLPSHWQDYPSPDILKDIGKEWLESGRSLILKVPSAVNPLEANYLVNPGHGEIVKVRVRKVHPLGLDSRL